MLNNSNEDNGPWWVFHDSFPIPHQQQWNIRPSKTPTPTESPTSSTRTTNCLPPCSSCLTSNFYTNNKNQHHQKHVQQQQQTVYLHVHPDVRDTRRGQLEGVVVRAEAVAADASVKLLFRLREQIQQNTCYL